nr:integrase, catalytic region, zinc finger, CCHC-type, peptidase aspartic, catalytic [Tanacetum cinerariifolium]
TPHYVPKVRESVFAKPHHVIASGSSRNSSNESYGSNDMAHKYYLEVAKKKTQDKNTSLKPSVRHTTSLQNTTNGSKPKPRSNNQTSRSFPIPKSSYVQASGLNVNKMTSAENTLGPSLQRKERCTLQCALSLEEEKSSCLRPFSSTSFMLFHARSVIKNGHMTPGYISSGLVQNSVSPTPYVPPSKKDYEIMFQQLFDEYFNPPPRAVSLVLASVAAPRAVDPAGSPSSTPIDQDVQSAITRTRLSPNILLQGLPKDIYTLINHYTDAKDIWENVKMLLEGSELTKEDRESQLYDDFEHFQKNQGETIHDYYVWFAKLINDMRNNKMTMSKMQLNSKFVNNMLPEWGRFVTVVKLNRGLRNSNYDQLYAYLKQHEAHANKMLDIADPSSEETTLQGFIPSNLHHLNQSFNTLTKLKMNHPLENVICDPSRSVLTRSQLQRFSMSQRTILVAQADYFLNLIMKFKMSLMMSLTLSYAKLKIQSMVDVPIHQEDLAVQRTPLIDTIILMVTDKTSSTPTPPTTQAHVHVRPLAGNTFQEEFRSAEHPSDTKILTMKMEILLVPTSNKLLVGFESDSYLYLHKLGIELYSKQLRKLLQLKTSKTQYHLRTLTAINHKP